MAGSSLGLIACRLCALLFAGIAIAATAVGVLALYWSALGLPAEFEPQFEPQFEDELPSQAAFFMAMLGGSCAVVGLLHAILSVPASLGRVWPLIAGTALWVLLVGPLLGKMVPGAPALNVVLPVVFASLALVALFGNRRMPGTAHASP